MHVVLAALARSVFDGSFEGLGMNTAWRRQSSAEWAARDRVEEASDDEDDAPMPLAPEPELIAMPPAPACTPPMSNLERCIALRLVYGAGPR